MVQQTGSMQNISWRQGNVMIRCAAIALVGILTGACETASAGEIHTELYGEGALKNGAKTLYWDIYVADNGNEGRALILLHGGGCHRGSRSDPHLVDLALQLARDGVTVVSPDYRLQSDDPAPKPYAVAMMAEAASDIWLPRFLASASSNEEALANLQDRVAACAAAAEDALMALRALRNQASQLGLDPDRIAIGGSSAGAIAALVAAYELASDDERPAAVVSLWGAAPGLAFTHGGPPMWALHGADDAIVTLAVAEETASRARRANVFARLHVQQDAGHGWREVDILEQAPGGETHYQALLEFLQM